MMNPTLAVIGLGHVGLTLALTLAEEGFTIFGVEKSQEVLEHLKKIHPPFFEKGLKDLLEKHLGKNLKLFEAFPPERVQLGGGTPLASREGSPLPTLRGLGAGNESRAPRDHYTPRQAAGNPQIETIDTHILCVGTPLDANQNPDLSVAKAALQETADHLTEGALVILRSTVPVGTSRHVFLPLLQKTKKKFHYACCPERTCEGIALKELRELPQVIGGLDETSFALAADIFKKISPTIVKAPSLEGAELTKLMDNCWRDTTFAFANEMALLCEELGLDVTEIISLANLGYSRNTIPRPGLVGGPCLTKDPFLLLKSVRTKAASLSLTQTARALNQDLPRKVLDRVKQFLNQHQKKIPDAKIFISGLAFKGDPATDDLRGSPGLDILKSLKQAGAKNLFVHDFVASPKEGQKVDTPWASVEEGFQNADSVLFLSNHENYKTLPIETLLAEMNRPAFFFDAWHLFPKRTTQKIKGVAHGGIGF